MENIVRDITELVGNTPLFEVSKFSKKNNTEATILAKLEQYNPAGSVKDRIDLSMIEDAEKKELINRDTLIIEPTSGKQGAIDKAN